MGGFDSGKKQPIKESKCYRWDNNFFDLSLSSLSETYQTELGFYPSLKDIVATRNTLFQLQRNRNGSCITFETSRKTQKNDTYFAIERSDLMFSPGLGSKLSKYC